MYKRISGLCILLGVCLILMAMGWTAYNLWDDQRAQVQMVESREILVEEIPEIVTPPASLTWESVLTLPAEDTRLEDVELPYYVANPDVEMLEVEVDGRNYIGMIEIPGLKLEIPVLSQWSSEGAKIAPCRYVGSAYQNNMVIAGHNYRTHFGRLSELGIGEQLSFTDMEGNLFQYEVIGMEILQPHQIEEMCTGDWDMTLFTCTIGGQKRVALRCKLIET